jgi:hypothetical protein
VRRKRGRKKIWARAGSEMEREQEIHGKKKKR